MYKNSQNWLSNNKDLSKTNNNNNELIFAAECLPNFHNNFFNEFIKDKTIILICPKKVNEKECLNTISQALNKNCPKAITICKIKLKCCKNLTNLVQQGLKITGKELVITEKTYDTKGKLISHFP